MDWEGMDAAAMGAQVDVQPPIGPRGFHGLFIITTNYRL